jgi:CDP-diacylglycerol--glycerol-3-phosphate 3-phosphatidyltransferase
MEDKEIDKNSRAYKIAAGKGVMNLPNKLTLSRMIMIPFFVLFFYLDFKSHFFIALAIFIVASLTDLFDGKIARKYNLVTNLGKFLDPIADKVLVSAAMIIFLTKPFIFTANLGDWAIIAGGCCVTVIIAREIIVSGFRMVAADAGIVIAADKIGKYKTFAQDASIVILLFALGLGEFVNHISVDIINCVGLALFAVATILTIISGTNYIVKNRNVLKV